MNPDIITPRVAKWAAIIGVAGFIASTILSAGIMESLAEKYVWARALLQLLTLLAAAGGALAGARKAKNDVTPIDDPKTTIAGKVVRLVPELPQPTKEYRAPTKEDYYRP